MSLTPEERRRIYEEEKARLEARDQAQRDLDKAKGKMGCGQGCGVVVLVLIGLAVLGSIINRSQEPSTPPVAPAAVDHYWVAREVVRYDLTKLPPVPTWENHRGPNGVTVQYKSRGECEMAFAEHQQLIHGNSEWQCVGF